MGRYDDIIGLERPLSSHVRLPRADRAKQFMPFASLRGFDDEIREREEVLEERRTPSEDEDAVKNARVKRTRARHIVPSCRPGPAVCAKPGRKRGRENRLGDRDRVRIRSGGTDGTPFREKDQPGRRLQARDLARGKERAGRIIN